MKQIIRQVLDELGDTQINLGSKAARETVASLVSVALKNKGSYREYTDEEIDKQAIRKEWVCELCGKSTADVDYDYIGSGTNHLGCELELESEKQIVQGINISQAEEVDGMYFDDEVKEWEEAVGYSEDDDNGDEVAKALGHMDDEGNFITESIQKQIYNEMTADGLPPGGDTQAVLESHKLAEEIVDNKDEKWIYESPDGGKTVFRRPFGDYDMKKKVEIDWETKEPTGRVFTDYNNGNWKGDER